MHVVFFLFLYNTKTVTNFPTGVFCEKLGGSKEEEILSPSDISLEVFLIQIVL